MSCPRNSSVAGGLASFLFLHFVPFLFLHFAVLALDSPIVEPESSTPTLACIVHSGPKYYESRLLEALLSLPEMCTTTFVQTTAHELTEFMAQLFPYVTFIGLEVEDSRSALWTKTEGVVQLLGLSGSALVSEGLGLVSEGLRLIEHGDSISSAEFQWPVLQVSPRQSKSLQDDIGINSSQSQCESAVRAVKSQIGTEPSKPLPNFILLDNSSRRARCQQSANFWSVVYSCLNSEGSYPNSDLYSSFVSLIKKLKVLCQFQTKMETDNTYTDLVHDACVKATDMENNGSNEEQLNRGNYISLVPRVKALMKFHLDKSVSVGSVNCDSARSCQEVLSKTFRRHDFYYHMDDDTFVIEANLKRFLRDSMSFAAPPFASLTSSASSSGSNQTGILYGRKYRSGFGLPYPAGGCGYIFDSNAIVYTARSIARFQNLATEEAIEEAKNEPPNGGSFAPKKEESSKRRLATTPESSTIFHSPFSVYEKHIQHLLTDAEDISIGYFSRLACELDQMDPFEIAVASHQLSYIMRFRKDLTAKRECVVFNPSRNPETKRQLFNNNDIENETRLERWPFWHAIVNEYDDLPAPVSEAVAFHWYVQTNGNAYTSLLYLNANDGHQSETLTIF